MMDVCKTLLVAALACSVSSALADPGFVDTASLKNIANVSYAAENAEPSGLASIFSPRMDFDQWKPLTGRGDPLRNDPTYDYEPPLLERVHYWADETRFEREHYPERKSEVLMLGVSSRKPSVSARQPPPRRHRPPPAKYEDFTYKLSDHYPMTILVPPPPPPSAHKPPPPFILDGKPPLNTRIKITEPPKLKETTKQPDHLTSLYALQEANLIYQASTTSNSWLSEPTKSLPNSVSSDYAGWGPTTPLDDMEVVNDTHNLISNDHAEFSKQPYSFYKPMLSESPPPQVTVNPLRLPTFLPTALPPLTVSSTTSHPTTLTWLTEPTTTEESIDTSYYNEETTTDKSIFSMLQSTPISVPKLEPEKTIMEMMDSMMSMPMVVPERPEDNLYAHASDNIHIYKKQKIEDMAQLETMQTMQPPPVDKNIDNSKQHYANSHTHNTIPHKASVHTLDPYLNMRFTTPLPTIATSVDFTETTTETPTVPMYLIIQGHSKVKTYSSKNKAVSNNETSFNEIPKPNETDEVKHLHPIKGKYTEKMKDGYRKSKAQSLKALVDEGRGSIEIQEADIGIKYDVSDGSEVPVEIYRKGLVDTDDSYYSKANSSKDKRDKRQLPDVFTLEEYLYNFVKDGKTNNTGGTTSATKDTTAEDSDDEDDEDDDEEESDEERDDDEYEEEDDR